MSLVILSVFSFAAGESPGAGLSSGCASVDESFDVSTVYGLVSTGGAGWTG